MGEDSNSFPSCSSVGEYNNSFPSSSTYRIQGTVEVQPPPHVQDADTINVTQAEAEAVDLLPTTAVPPTSRNKPSEPSDSEPSWIIPVLVLSMVVIVMFVHDHYYTNPQMAQLEQKVERLSDLDQNIVDMQSRLSNLERTISHVEDANIESEDRIQALEQVQYQTNVHVFDFDHTELTNQEGLRSSIATIAFRPPFVNIPHVSVGGIRKLEAQSLRVATKVLRASKESFTIEVETWDDTQLDSISIEWIATDIGAATRARAQ